MNYRTIIINLVMKLGNRIIRQYDGGSDRPIFFNGNKTYPNLALVDANFETIKSEFENINKHFEIPAYHDIERRVYAISGRIEQHVK